MNNKGWECPKCKRVNAPSVKECPCSVNKEDSPYDWDKIKEILDKDRGDFWPKEKREQESFPIPQLTMPYYHNYDPCLTCPNRGKGPCHCTLPYMSRTTYLSVGSVM